MNLEMITLPIGRSVHLCAIVTCVEELVKVRLGVPHQEDVVHRDAAQQIQEEPALHVVLGNLLGIEYNLVRKVVQNYTC